MKIKTYKLCVLTFLSAFLFMCQSNAQQAEIEYDSQGDNPQLRLVETGPGNSFVRLQMQNQNAGHWSLASINGPTSSVFNIFHSDDVNFKNYVIIDAIDDVINLNSDCDINDGDLTINGQDPDLFISSDATADPSIFFGDNGGASDGKIWYDSDRDVMKFGTSTSNGAVNVNGSGKTGFNIDRFSSTEELDAQVTIRANSGNTSTPAHLELNENNNSGFPNIQFTNFGLTGLWEISARSEGSPTNNGFMHFSHTATGTNAVQVLSIDGSDERVGVLDDTPEYTLSVDHGAASPNQSGAAFGFNLENTSSNDGWTFYTSSSSGDLRIYHDATTGTGAVPILRGTFNSTNGSYTNNSDLRLKKNISNLENQLDKVMQMRPTRYQFKSQEGEDYSLGLIAQELQEIVPEVVSQVTNMEEDGNEFLGVSYTELIPVLIGAIQDQQDIIDAQKTELSEVKASLANMTDTMKAEIANMIKAELSKTNVAQLKAETTTTEKSTRE